MRHTNSLYLREDIQFEPLVNSWYSWPLLIAPATAAMVINNHHLRIMESFVRAPELNREAARNPAMRGGPFMDFAGDVACIRDLITTTRNGCADLLTLAAAIKELDQCLAAEAKGASLAALYPRVPPPLRGFVELGYDLGGSASFRLIEALLYRSRFYQPSLQTLLLSMVQDDKRPFALSTPRLPSETEVQLRLPFHSKDIDTLASMRVRSVDASFVNLLAEEYVDGGGAGRDLFRSFFTESP
ncbi:MAG TPA: hypothetical protein VFS58_16190, partial [Steroidobacteraceae bacterium]|nr:hypothetical protein [Steroidobacteraceae bacterium]